MKTVHIFTHTTIRIKAKTGASGYVLALEKDGEIAKGINHIYITDKQTAQAALLDAITKAVARFREPVVLHIWTDEQLIASAVTKLWVEKWASEEFEGRKNADEWREFLSICRRKEIDIRGIWFHVKQPHQYREWLRWECDKAIKEGNYGERNQKHQSERHHGAPEQSAQRAG